MKSFEELGAQLGKLVSAKNKAYGNAAVNTAKMLRVAFPDGIPPEKYEDALLIIRVMDKILRAANDKNAFGESPWEDIGGYGILGWRKDLEQLSEGD